MVSTAISLATSPAACPPMPSATTKIAPLRSISLGSLGTIRVMLSSFESRLRPTSVSSAISRRSCLDNALLLNSCPGISSPCQGRGSLYLGSIIHWHVEKRNERHPFQPNIPPGHEATSSLVATFGKNGLLWTQATS